MTEPRITPTEAALELDRYKALSDTLAVKLTLAGQLRGCVEAYAEHGLEPCEFVKREWTGKD